MSDPSVGHLVLYVALIVIVMGVLERVEARRTRVARARREPRARRPPASIRKAA